MSKRTTVLSLLVIAAALLFTVTRTWVFFELSPQDAINTQVEVSGQDGIGALMPVVIALLALAVVLGIAGKILTYIIGGFVTVFGVWVTVTVAQLAAQSSSRLISFGSASIAENTGLLGQGAEELVTGVTETPWPWVTVALGGLITLLGGSIFVFARRWRQGGRRFESRAASTAHEHVAGEDRIADWDLLSEGNDPTGYSPGGAEHGRLEAND